MSGIQIVSFVLYIILASVQSIVSQNMGHGLKSWERWAFFSLIWITWSVAYKA